MISNIHIPDRVLNNVSAKDIAMFMNQVTTNPNYQKAYEKMSVCDMTTEDNTKMMMTVTIRFQMWKKKENGTGTIFEWFCYRAKDHSCSNTQIKELNGIELKKLLKEVA